MNDVLTHDSTLQPLDALDYRILKALSEDARASDVALGEAVALSSTAVSRRRRNLEERGVIRSYSANLDLQALGFGGVVIVSIELSSQAEAVLVEFERAVIKCPSMSYCGFVSGDADFLMIIHVDSFNDFDTVFRKEIAILPHVARIRSSFVMREVARRANPPAIFNRARR